MVSYADMITIMMAFFVVMYALSGKKDESTIRPVISALKQQFGPDWPFANLVPGRYRPRNPHLDKFKMQGKPEDAPGRGGGAAEPVMRRSRMFRPGEGLARGGCVFFDDFAVQLSDAQKLQIQRVATDIAGKPQKIEVRGHASRRPLPANSPYHDHWDLAYARCRAVMEYLVSLGIDPKRIRMAVAGIHEPGVAGEEDAPAGGASRVEIFMLNEFVNDPAK